MDEDELYGLPQEQFVPERDALARRLRQEGDREGAARLKGLRKPTVAAWAVNQIIRTQRAAGRELAAAGEAVRGAQEAVLRGQGSAAELREASERERAAVDALTMAARGLLSQGGGTLSDSVIESVRETLHAATTGDEETRTAVLSGRLDRERKAAGLGGGFDLAAAGAPTRPTRRRRPAPAAPIDDEAEKRAAREREAARIAELKAVARKAVAVAERAERDYERAVARLEAAEAALAKARAALADARLTEREARRERDRTANEAQRRRTGLRASDS
jgi:hypothetical protein